MRRDIHSSQPILAGRPIRRGFAGPASCVRNIRGGLIAIEC